MVRLLLRLFNIKDFEVCQSCETLKQQLEFERDEKKRLTDTLLNILSPKVVESPPVELNQIAQSSAIFSRRRAALEAKDREDARILKASKNLGKPDDSIRSATPIRTVEQLEAELGVETENPEQKEA